MLFFELHSIVIYESLNIVKYYRGGFETWFGFETNIHLSYTIFRRLGVNLWSTLHLAIERFELGNQSLLKTLQQKPTFSSKDLKKYSFFFYYIFHWALITNKLQFLCIIVKHSLSSHNFHWEVNSHVYKSNHSISIYIYWLLCAKLALPIKRKSLYFSDTMQPKWKRACVTFDLETRPMHNDYAQKISLGRLNKFLQKINYFDLALSLRWRRPLS